MENNNKPCYACGKSLNYTEKELARRYKKEFEEKGIVRYFFKRNKNAKTEFARAESFKNILPILEKRKQYGSEYAHISEFETN